jgi:hypothetical protein
MSSTREEIKKKKDAYCSNSINLDRGNTEELLEQNTVYILSREGELPILLAVIEVYFSVCFYHSYYV